MKAPLSPLVIRIMTMMALVVVLLATGGSTQAQQAAPNAPSADDGVRECGDEWVNDYPGTGSDLSATDDDARGICSKLRSSGFTWRFDYGNSQAWEEDWKRSGAGGTEYAYVDTVDMAYFSGHGSGNAIVFGVGGNTHDDTYLTYQDCRDAWGDGDAEWVALSACNILDNPHMVGWSYCMKGLHLIFGFKTTMADTAHGVHFGNYINWGWDMTNAWFLASNVSQPSGKIARVIAEEDYQFNDRPANHNSADQPQDNDFFWREHKVGCEPARPVDISALDGTMPVFTTPYLSADEANSQWSNLGGAFGVTTTRLTIAPQSLYPAQTGEVWVSEDGQLQMDSASGLYIYGDKARLGAEPGQARVQAGYRIMQIGPTDAKDIADKFLTDNDLMPGDAFYWETVADTQSMGQKGAATLSVETFEPVQTETLDWQVVYSRKLTYTPTKLDAEPITFSVVGPGAKLKVYVAPEAMVNLEGALTESPVIGGVGGWRATGSGPTLAAVQEVPVLDYAQVEMLFNTLESTVSLGYIPVLFDSREVASHTVGYYEHSLGTGQDQLIPTYILAVKYVLSNGGGETTSDVHIPANPQFSAPLAKITSQVPTLVKVGQQVTLQAADASKKLSELGYDAALDFPLGTGNPDSYTYNWYLDVVDDDHKIGGGRYLDYTVPETSARPGGGPERHTIILEVKDGLSPRPPSTMTASVDILIAGQIYLPVIVRQ